jgi:apolipoprotein N-acyltransferase
MRRWMRLINLPYDDFTPGPFVQPPLPAGGLKLSASVCYEDAYGSQVIANLGNADALVNVTNDAWFGHSSARHQHLQIARMRAIETGRDMIRAANDGISAVIGPHGEIRAQAPAFKSTLLRTQITPRRGTTPYVRAGNWPIVIVALAALAYAVVRDLRRRR